MIDTKQQRLRFPLALPETNVLSVSGTAPVSTRYGSAENPQQVTSVSLPLSRGMFALIDLEDLPLVPAAPACIAEPERGRLSRQAQAILERLRSGKATNGELCSMALNYRARISDCRAAGYDIRVTARDRATGVTVYELVEAR